MKQRTGDCDALGPLQTTKAVLSTYTGEKIPVLGAVMVPVKYESQQKKLNALIAKGGRPNLLGQDWLEEIRLDWNTIFQIASDNPLIGTSRHAFKIPRCIC